MKGNKNEACLIESWGNGTLKMMRLCAEAGLTAPEFETGKSLFAITFHNVIDNETSILQAIRGKHKISAKKLAQKMGIAKRTVQRYIKVLQENGKII